MFKKSLLSYATAFLVATASTAQATNLNRQTRKLFISVALNEENGSSLKDGYYATDQGVIMLHARAWVTHVLTQDNIDLLNKDLDKKVADKDRRAIEIKKAYGKEIFKKGETIAHTLAKVATTSTIPQHLSFMYPSMQLKVLLESGQMSKEQIDYLEDFFKKYFSETTKMGTPNGWMENFSKLIERARILIKKN